MEGYEDFIRTQLLRLKEAGGEQKREPVRRGSSVIRFHGAPILPPLLTAERREEMLRRKTFAQQLDDRRSESALSRRMLHLRELLDSVQLRKAPTLQEFMGDEPLAGTGERGRGETEGGATVEAGLIRPDSGDPSLLSRPPHHPDKEACDPFCPLTSTTRGPPSIFQEFLSPVEDVGHVSAWDAGEGGGACRTGPEVRLPVGACGDVSHRSVSSGYATQDNTEVTEGQAEVTEGHPRLRWFTLSEAGPSVGAEAPGFKGPAGGSVGPEAPVQPPRMSLQALLKRSQEYRQQQRQLRHARIAQSLVNKENQPAQIQFRRVRDRRPGTGRVQLCSTKTVRPDRPLRTSGAAQDEGTAARPESSEPVEPELCQEGGRTVTLCEVTAVEGPEEGDGLSQHKLVETPSDPPRVESPPPASKTPPLNIQLDRYGTVPTLQFCSSPVHCKSRMGHRTVRKLPVNTQLSTSGGHRGRQSDGVGEAGLEGGGGELAQLEVNLSSLKTLISDLQATLITDTTNHEEEGAELHLPDPTHIKDHTLQPATLRPVPSLNQSWRVPGVFRKIPGEHSLLVPVLSDTSNQEPPGDGSPNRSYDVWTPSALWPPGGGRVPGSASRGKPLPPEEGLNEGLDSGAKCSLLMNTGNQQGANRPLSGIMNGCSSLLDKRQSQLTQAHAGQLHELLQAQQMQLKQSHAQELRALIQTQQMQLQELLQNLSLQGMSVPGSSPSSGVKGVVSRLEPLPSEQPSVLRPHLQTSRRLSFSSAWRSLVAAVVKGYLTRRLLRTERLTQLQRTIKDSLQFLRTLQTHTPLRGELGGRQDRLLQERVLLQ
ncbi:hypothetical protein GJAV_G00142260, partial [Gymnothorax javanicus]